MDAISQGAVPPEVDAAEQMLLMKWSERILRLVEVVVGFAAVFSCLARLHPLFDLATHATWHCFWLAIILVVLTVVRLVRLSSEARWTRRSVFRALCCGFSLIYFGMQLQDRPLLRPPRFEDRSNTQPLKILSWNILLINTQSADLIELVERENADVVILLEVNRPMGTLLESLRERYAAAYWNPEWSSGGTIILSHIAGTEFRELPLAAVGNLAIEIQIPGSDSRAPMDLLAVHTFSPVSFNRARWRDRQLQGIGDWFGSRNGKACAIGDFNTTAWSPGFQDLIRSRDLIDSRSGIGRLPSWPSFFGALGIPIDHALVNRQTQVLERKTLSTAPGSDHRPIIVVLQ